MSAARIRPYRPEDLESLYDIALATGDSGQDASAIYQDGRLVGHVFAAPYGVLQPQSCFVAEDDAGVAAYIVGAVDTTAFDAEAEARWWPTLRPQYPDPSDLTPPSWTRDQQLIWSIHHPVKTPRRLAQDFPSHLHINLLPRLQGQGLGKALIDTWLGAMRAAGSKGVHLGVSPANARALRFYPIYGFQPWALADPKRPGAIWFTMELG